MPERPPTDLIQRIAGELVGLQLTEAEAEALAGLYGATARGVAAFPSDELHTIEAPLRSVPAA